MVAEVGVFNADDVGDICVDSVRPVGVFDCNGGIGNPFSLAFQAARTRSIHNNN